MGFKVGQKVKVTNCHNGGNFENGDIVEIVQIGTDDGDETDCYGAISPYDNRKWYLYEDEISPVTNADKIHSMSNEEFAEFYCLNTYKYCEHCTENWKKCEIYKYGLFPDENCKKALIKWLNDTEEKTYNYGTIEIIPATNSDKIRSMSDEELAKFIVDDRWDCNDCPSGQENTDNPFGSKCDNQCIKHCLEWLKEGVK